MSRIPFSTDEGDDISSLTAGKIFVDRIPVSNLERLNLKVGTGSLEIIDGRVEFKSAVTCAVAGITFSDASTIVKAYTGGNGVSVSTDNVITATLPQSLGTGDTVTFKNLNIIDTAPKILMRGTNSAHVPVFHMARPSASSFRFLMNGTLHIQSYTDGSVIYADLMRMLPNNANPIRFFGVGGSVVSMNGVSLATVSSDDRIKFNETIVTDALNVIGQVNIYRYDKVHILGDTPATHPYVEEIGVIAQEIETIPQLSCAVHHNSVTDGDEDNFPNGIPMSVNYDIIHSYHIKATQELHAIVNAQSVLISDLTARLTALEN